MLTDVIVFIKLYKYLYWDTMNVMQKMMIKAIFASSALCGCDFFKITIKIQTSDTMNEDL